MFLIDDILLSPLNGFVWLGKKIDELYVKEVSDEGRVMENLMALQLRFELDEINEDEYNAQEKEILAKLEAIRKMKEKENGLR
ncbi:MAG: gas vesicle protein GvpG [Elusimicrobia bacterium]|nr:gas vesicle protein GvpG [Elusimicrobiota bacterium]